MATIIAKIDMFDPRWESGELEDVLYNNKSKESVFEWMRTNCKCKPEKVLLRDNFDDVIINAKKMRLYYDSWPMCESFYMVRL